MKMKCSSLGCSEKIYEDELDCTCFDCNYIFCDAHISYYKHLTEDDILQRQQDIHVCLANDPTYLKRMDEEVVRVLKDNAEIKTVKDMLAIPLCKECKKIREDNA